MKSIVMCNNENCRYYGILIMGESMYASRVFCEDCFEELFVIHPKGVEIKEKEEEFSFSEILLCGIPCLVLVDSHGKYPYLNDNSQILFYLHKTNGYNNYRYRLEEYTKYVEEFAHDRTRHPPETDNGFMYMQDLLMYLENKLERLGLGKLSPDITPRKVYEKVMTL